MSKYFLTEDRLKDLQWRIKRDIPSADDRTKNDPCYLMSSKKIFEMIAYGAGYAIASAEKIDEVNLIQPSEIFNNSSLAEYILGIVRVESIKLGWSEVKQYNGQYVFISDLYKPEPSSRTVTKTVIVKPADLDNNSSLNLLGPNVIPLDVNVFVKGCSIVEAKTLDLEYDIQKADFNSRVQLFGNGANVIGTFNSETGNLSVGSALAASLILTVEYTLGSAKDYPSYR